MGEQTGADGVLWRQRADPAKVERARELRCEMTPAEKRLWAYLRGRRFFGFRFRRQQVVAGFIADFYCHALRLVVEVDGDIHDSQPEYDAERDAVLAGHGLTVLRIANDEVLSDTRAALLRVKAAIDARSSESHVGDAGAKRRALFRPQLTEGPSAPLDGIDLPSPPGRGAGGEGNL